MNEIQFVRIVPKGNHYVIEIGYCVEEPEVATDPTRFVAIDLGLNNLATLG